METIKKFFSSKQHLSNPGKLKDYNKELLGVLVGKNDLAEGLNLNIVKEMLRSETHEAAVFHSFIVPSQAPADYNMGVQISSAYGSIYSGHFAVSGGMQAVIRQVLSDRFALNLTYVNTQKILDSEVVYTGNNFTGTVYAGTSGVKMSYHQALSKALTAGVELHYNPFERKSNLFTAAKYSTNNSTATAELRLKDTGGSNDTVIKLGYLEQVEERVSLVADLTWDVTNRSTLMKYGFQFTTIGGRVRVTADPALNLLCVFDHKLTPASQVSISVEANPNTNQYKFGAGLQLQS